MTGVLGNTAANGVWDATITDANTITLTGSVGNGVWSAGGTQKVGPAGQANALAMDVGSVQNRIRVTHQASKVAQTTVRTALKSGSVLTGGNDLSIGGMGGSISPVFVTTYTPDPYVATNIFMGTLTNNITIAAPTNSHVGARLTFFFLQDGTGGRTITWNGAFTQNYADTGNTLGKRMKISFIYNGATWLEEFASQSAVAGTYWV